MARRESTCRRRGSSIIIPPQLSRAPFWSVVVMAYCFRPSTLAFAVGTRSAQPVTSDFPSCCQRIVRSHLANCTEYWMIETESCHCNKNAVGLCLPTRGMVALLEAVIVYLLQRNNQPRRTPASSFPTFSTLRSIPTASYLSFSIPSTFECVA